MARNSPGVTWGHMGLVHIDQLDLPTLHRGQKVMGGKKFTRGSLGVTGVKRSFSLKNAISPSKYMVWS